MLSATGLAYQCKTSSSNSHLFASLLVIILQSSSPPLLNTFLYQMPSRREKPKCSEDLLPLVAWIFGIAAALAIRYGCYGNTRLALGPNSSRMLKASSVFVEEVHVRSEENKEVLLYGFTKPPVSSLETNWTISNHLVINSYSRKGLHMWLNKGSKIFMELEVAYGSESYGDSLLVVIKGQQNLKELQRLQTKSNIEANNSIAGTKEVEYGIEEDGNYYIGIENLDPWSKVTTLIRVNVTSKVYDTSEATSICSTSKGDCRLKLLFPNTEYFVLTTPNIEMNDTVAWNVEFSFYARLVTYSVIVGCVVIIIYVILNYFGGSNGTTEAATTRTETDPIMPVKEKLPTYRTAEENATSSLCCSSDDLYDNKICAICYDETRNCFFIPCGHCVTCYTCAQRIMEEENKVCPVCRRLIHKARRLLIP